MLVFVFPFSPRGKFEHYPPESANSRRSDAVGWSAKCSVNQEVWLGPSVPLFPLLLFSDLIDGRAAVTSASPVVFSPFPVDPTDQARHALNLVQVEGVLARDRAVEACFEERGPCGARVLPKTRVVLAHSGNPGENGLAAVHVFNRSLAEEKVDKALKKENLSNHSTSKELNAGGRAHIFA